MFKIDAIKKLYDMSYVEIKIDKDIEAANEDERIRKYVEQKYQHDATENTEECIKFMDSAIERNKRFCIFKFSNKPDLYSFRNHGLLYSIDLTPQTLDDFCNPEKAETLHVHYTTCLNKLITDESIEPFIRYAHDNNKWFMAAPMFFELESGHAMHVEAGLIRIRQVEPAGTNLGGDSTEMFAKFTLANAEKSIKRSFTREFVLKLDKDSKATDAECAHKLTHVLRFGFALQIFILTPQDPVCSIAEIAK